MEYRYLSTYARQRFNHTLHQKPIQAQAVQKGLTFFLQKLRKFSETMSVGWPIKLALLTYEAVPYYTGCSSSPRRLSFIKNQWAALTHVNFLPRGSHQTGKPMGDKSPKNWSSFGLSGEDFHHVSVFWVTQRIHFSRADRLLKTEFHTRVEQQGLKVA